MKRGKVKKKEKGHVFCLTCPEGLVMTGIIAFQPELRSWQHRREMKKFNMFIYSFKVLNSLIKKKIEQSTVIQQFIAVYLSWQVFCGVFSRMNKELNSTFVIYLILAYNAKQVWVTKKKLRDSRQAASGVFCCTI